MSSEAITRNDLTAILNEVLPPTPSEYRKLLWTNPNPTSTFAAQTITVPDISEYDDLEFDIRGGGGSAFSCFSAKYPVDLLRMHGEVWLLNPAQGATNLPSVNGRKMIFTSDTQVSFSTGAYWNTSGYNTGSENSGVPIRIYGIKYERVAPPQLAIPTIAHNENFVGSSGTINKTYTATDAGIYIILARSNAYAGSSVPEIRISVNNTRIAQNADAGGSVMTYLATTLSAGDVVGVEYTASNGGAEGDWCNLTIIQLA